MNIAILVESYPSSYQTFVDYHVKELNAHVLSLYSDNKSDDTENPHTLVCSRGRVRKENLMSKTIRRSREALFGMETKPIAPQDRRCFSAFLRKKDVKVLLIEFAPMAIAAMKSGLLDHIPFVVHFHGYDASSMLRFPSYVKDLARLFDRASAIVVVSEYMKNTLVSLGCSENKLSVIPCGANVSGIPRAERISDGCVFLAASRLIEGKGLVETLNAFEVCVNELENIRLDIIGDGPLLNRLRKYIKQKGVEKKVRLLGRLSHEDVLQHMRNSDVFVQHSKMSSIGGVEGWGVSLAEAAATGLPVISTRHGGIPDQVINGVTGYLVDEGDWRAMADRMCYLAQNAEQRRKIGEAGRENILQVGNASHQVKKLRGVLEKVLCSYETSR